jgi:hypothetical protein
MSKLRTLNQVLDYLDHEFVWRLQEIADMKSVIRGAKSVQQRTLIRAGVALLYAHLEGFIKKSSEAFLNFVANQGLTYSQLKPCFVTLGLNKELHEVITTRNTVKSTRAVEFLRSELGKIAKIPYKDVIDAKSNLNFSVFEEIAYSIGIEVSKYQKNGSFIDESLLKTRNQIAHGEYLVIQLDGYEYLSDEVVTLMRTYKDDIQNALVLKSYKIA